MAKRKKKLKKYPISRFMRGNVIVPILFIVVAFGVLLTSGALYNKSATNPKEEYGQAQTEGGNGKQNLQLKNVSFQPKPTPVPQSGCYADSCQPIGEECTCPDLHLTCKAGKCVSVDINKSGSAFKTYTCAMIDQNGWCKLCGSTNMDGTFCIGKPVIYLYPEKPTYVDVAVKTEGDIVVSDPTYPLGGWKQVLARPDGTLEYHNKQYRELFYETESRTLSRPKAGIIVHKQNLKTELLTFIKNLGLTREDEQREFLEWWIPRLEAIKTDRIFFSVLESDEKERVDKVSISPRPDTFIQFIVYFAPLSDGETVTPLVLPPTPRRVGFTAIEWGGAIGR